MTQTSDDVLGAFSSPNSSLHSICEGRFNGQSKSRRFGCRYNASVLFDILHDSKILSCTSIEGFRQQSEPALLQYTDDMIAPELLRSESQPILHSNEDLPLTQSVSLVDTEIDDKKKNLSHKETKKKTSSSSSLFPHGRNETPCLYK